MISSREQEAFQGFVGKFGGHRFSHDIVALRIPFFRVEGMWLLGVVIGLAATVADTIDGETRFIKIPKGVNVFKFSSPYIRNSVIALQGIFDALMRESQSVGNTAMGNPTGQETSILT